MRALVCVGLLVWAAASLVQAQERLRGNPTPGTSQPDMPKLADRITLTGCVARADGAAATFDSNTPSDTRYLLTGARREKRVPAGSGTSTAAATTAAERYRLSGIEGAIAPFAGARVEVSGQVEPPSPDAAQLSPTLPVLRVEFVRKLAASCS